VQDLRLAVRALRATPIVTAIAILSLGLGIGANTAIFSLVSTLLLRTLPVAEPQRLVSVSTGPAETQQIFSRSTLDQIRQHGQAFDGALAWSLIGPESLTFGAQTWTVESQFVSGDFFTMLGVPALVGRTIMPADDVRGGGVDGPVAVIAYGLWQRLFGGETNVIGKRVRIGRVPVTVVGVAPPEFFGVIVGRAVDLLLPVRTQPLVEAATPIRDDEGWLRLMLRLKPGQSLEMGAAALRAQQPQIRAGAMPEDTRAAGSFLKDPLTLDPISRGVSPLRQRFERPLVTVLTVAGFVLLIASANVANLLLARGAARRHELSVRLALGASRWRLARQFLVESVVLAASGAVTGLAFSTWASRGIVAQLSTPVMPLMLDLSLDWRVLGFTAAAMIATVMLCGVAPALRATHLAPMDSLKEHGRTGAGGAQSHLSNGLIVVQVAVSLMLIVAAGLFVRTFDRLVRASLGFDRDRVLVVTVTAPTIPAGERNPVYHRLVRAAETVPGVSGAGGSLQPPLIGSLITDVVVTAPGDAPRPAEERMSKSNLMTPGWLTAYGTPIRAGRDIDDRDTRATLPVMVVNEAFVRRFVPHGSPIGTPIAVAAGSHGEFSLGTMTVIGVAGDAVANSIREPIPPTMYFPLAQFSDPIRVDNFYIAVRSAGGPPALLTRSVAAALTAVNPDLTLTFHPLAEQVSASLAQDRAVAMLSGFFGALAMLLAGLGLYGVTAYAVSRRRVELGIRMALGAGPAGVVRLVMSRVSLLVGSGVIVGSALSLWASRFIASLLYGLEPRDPVTLVGAAITLAAVGALAGWLPAWRASRVDPAEVLRES
jgi:putative ABC transport system permease protein